MLDAPASPPPSSSKAPADAATPPSPVMIRSKGMKRAVDSVEMFKAINAAYTFLSDPAKRRGFNKVRRDYFTMKKNGNAGRWDMK